MISKRRHWADDVYDRATRTRISTKHKSGNKMKEKKKIVIKKCLHSFLKRHFYLNSHCHSHTTHTMHNQNYVILILYRPYRPILVSLLLM